LEKGWERLGRPWKGWNLSKLFPTFSKKVESP
jgi:hypothetical protein